jgi:hypothetical protein
VIRPRTQVPPLLASISYPPASIKALTRTTAVRRDSGDRSCSNDDVRVRNWCTIAAASE